MMYPETKRRVVLACVFVAIWLDITLICSLRTEKKQTVNSLNATLVYNNSINLRTEVLYQCQYNSECTISCASMALKDVITGINALLEQASACNTGAAKALTILGTSLSIQAGWLQEVNVTINKLRLESVDLTIEGDSIFSGTPFSSTLDLVLVDTAVDTIDNSFLKGSSLSSLHITYNTITKVTTIEQNAFDASLFTSLKEIVLNRCLNGNQGLMNITSNGTVSLGNLQSLDAGGNTLNTLENSMFLKVPNLEQLYLMDCSISSVDVDAFKGLFKLTQLVLLRNNIVTLSDGTANDLTSLVQFYVSDNPWKCDCNLLWLKQYLDGLSSNENRQCRVGSESVNMEDVDFCPETSTTTTTTTSTTKTSTSTTIAPRSSPTTPIPTTTTENVHSGFTYETIRCRKLKNDSESKVEITTVWYNLLFKKRNIQYTLFETSSSGGNGEIGFTVKFLAELQPEDFFIWTNVDTPSEQGCVFNIVTNVEMTLKAEQTYTLCLSKNTTEALVLDDCTAFATPPLWGRRPWIMNQSKLSVILGIGLGLLIAGFLAALIAYCFIKRNPELIKGNKRVLIVKKGNYSPNVLIMQSPKPHRHVSLCTDNEGYLSPKKVKETMRYEELTGEGKNGIYEPPPVPPNHPTKRRESCRPYFYSNM